MSECEALDFELLPDCDERDFEPPVPARTAPWLDLAGSPLVLPELPGLPERPSRIGIFALISELLPELEPDFLSREFDLFFISRLQAAGGAALGWDARGRKSSCPRNRCVLTGGRTCSPNYD